MKKHFQSLFPIVFIYYEILLRVFTSASVFSSFHYILLFSLSLGFICNAFVLLFKRKYQWIISEIIMILATVVYAAETLTKRTFQVFMTPSSLLGNAGNVANGFGSDLINSIVGGIVVIIVFFIPVVIYLLGRKRIYEVKRHLMVVVCIVLATGCFLTGSIIAKHGKYKLTYTTQYDFNSAIADFGLATGLRLEYTGGNKEATLVIDDTSSGEEETQEEPVAVEEPVEYGLNAMNLDLDTKIATETNETINNINQYVNSLAASSKNEYTGLFEGKNLILICAEAFSDAVIDEQLTPTLYRLTHNGFYFSDYYQPTWGGSTSTGEYSFLTGLVPCDGTDTMLKTIGHNMYFTLGNALQRENYYSGAYHSGTYDYYSRNQTHQNLGYDYFLAQDNGLETVLGASWVEDEQLLCGTLDTYVNYQPFSMYYMTLSGHCPYNRADHRRVTENLSTVLARYGDKYPEYVNYYICYQLELEQALTSLVQKLEDYGIADDTVIVLTSDHYPYGLDVSTTFGNTKNYVEDLYGYSYDTPWGKDRNGLIIWSGCLENENKDMACEVSTPTYSLDVVPTLLNLFGIEYDSRLLVGRDVFSGSECLVIWNNYSWKTTKGTYNSATQTFTPNEGIEIPEGYVDRINNTVANKINFSKQVLYNDYYGYLFGSDPITSDNTAYFNAHPEKSS